MDQQYGISARAEADVQGNFTLRNVPKEGILTFSFGAGDRKSERKYLSMSTDVLIPREEPYEVLPGPTSIPVHQPMTRLTNRTRR